MTSLYTYGAIAVLVIGLGWYAKAATERAALAEAALDTLAQGYEQYEQRIEEGREAQRRKDAEWKRVEGEYDATIAKLKNRPVAKCDRAAVDHVITERLLSAAGYREEGGGDPPVATGYPKPSGPSPYLSNRGQSEWIAGYQKELDKCIVQLTEISKLVEKARD